MIIYKRFLPEAFWLALLAFGLSGCANPHISKLEGAAALAAKDLPHGRIYVDAITCNIIPNREHYLVGAMWRESPNNQLRFGKAPPGDALYIARVGYHSTPGIALFDTTVEEQKTVRIRLNDRKTGFPPQADHLVGSLVAIVSPADPSNPARPGVQWQVDTTCLIIENNGNSVRVLLTGDSGNFTMDLHYSPP